MYESSLEKNFSIIAACIPTVAPFFTGRNRRHDQGYFRQVRHEHAPPRAARARDPFSITGFSYPDSQSHTLAQETHSWTDSNTLLRPTTRTSSVVK